MRHTELTFWDDYEPSQEKLDKFWNLIEDNDDLNWRVEHNGDVTLEVYSTTPVEHSEDLNGRYTIKGIYKPDLSYHRGDYQERTYFFVQEGI